MNQFKEQLNTSLQTLKNGGVIVYPTDTLWAIGCDATNTEAVSKVHALKKSYGTPLVCLVNNQALLERFVINIPEVAYDILDLTLKPTTLVLDQPKGFAPNCCAKDGSIAVRVATDKFCKYLINNLKQPIVATIANFHGTDPYPKDFNTIPQQILESVDYVVTLQDQKKSAVPSSLIRLSTDGTVRIIRE